MINRTDYQLRHAAGKYWLLDMRQHEITYRKPICLNESGARLWELFASGLDPDGIAERLGEEYGVPSEQTRRDVEAFFRQLEDC